MLDPGITAEAERLLELGAVRRAPVPVHELAELAGAEVRSGAMPRELSGFLIRQHGRPIIGVNATHSLVCQRFTIAHELGHVSLRPDQS